MKNEYFPLGETCPLKWWLLSVWRYNRAGYVKGEIKRGWGIRVCGHTWMF